MTENLLTGELASDKSDEAGGSQASVSSPVVGSDAMDADDAKRWFFHYLVRSWLPEGTSGEWRVQRLRFDGDFDDWFTRLDLTSGFTPPGEYTALMRADEYWMTDEPRELHDSRPFCQEAAGRVLITGLGLGAVPSWLARQDRIVRIDIVEREQDVIRLVWPHLSVQSDKLHIHHADALEWQPTSQWDFAWHDIWPKYPTADQRKHIEARYAPFVAKQMSWQRLVSVTGERSATAP